MAIGGSIQRSNLLGKGWLLVFCFSSRKLGKISEGLVQPPTRRLVFSLFDCLFFVVCWFVVVIVSCVGREVLKK